MSIYRLSEIVSTACPTGAIKMRNRSIVSEYKNCLILDIDHKLEKDASEVF